LVAINSLVLLAAGVAIWRWGSERYDRALWKEVTDFDIRRAARANEFNEDEFAHTLAANGLIVSLGGTCIAGGAFGLILSAAIGIRNPPPGSTLTFHGWKARGERSAGAIAGDKAWQAAMFGFFGSLPWIWSLWLGISGSLLLSSHLATELIVILLVECGLFYSLGIRLCRRRDPAAVVIAKTPWRVAIALNYGGLCAFLFFIGTMFILRSQS
jgi:hypothetical protein